MKEKRVIFMGTPDFSVPVLKALIENTNVVCVVSQGDKLVGRKKILTPSPVKLCALENNIPVLTPKKLKEEYNDILFYEPDIIITCAYGKIVPKEILDYPKYGCINVHGSILPKYRGASPIQTCIMNGDTKTGITIMYMDEGMDTGNIIHAKEIDISDTDTYGSLSEKLSILGRDLLIETLPKIFDGTNFDIPQDNENATYTKLIKREDETLDFNDTAINIHNKVRALNPTPLANVIIDNIEWKIIETEIGRDTNLEVGSITNITKDSFSIACIDKELIVKRVKLQGKKEMSVKDLFNGYNKDNLIDKKVGI